MIRRRLYAEIRSSKLAAWSWRFAAFALPVYLMAVVLHRAGAVEYQTAILMATHNAQVIERFPGRVYRVANGRVEEVD